MSFFRRAGDSSGSESEESEEELLSSSEGEGEAPAKKSTINRSAFLAGGDDDSDSDDDDDEDDMDASGSDESDEDGNKKSKSSMRSRFLAGADSDSDSDSDDSTSGKRVVKSAASKRADEIEAIAKKMDNGVKIDDWNTINAEFDKLLRLVMRVPGTIPGSIQPLAPTFLKTLVSLDEAVPKAGSAGKKKMNAINARSLNTMKQKVKRCVKENEAVLEKYKTDPKAYEIEFEGDEPEQKTKKKRAKKTSVLEEGEGADFTTVGKGGKATIYTTDNIFKSLQELLEARGKKGTDRTEQLASFERLFAVCDTPYSQIRVLLALISSSFDYNPVIHAALPIDSWKSALQRINDLLVLLSNNPRYIIQEQTEDYDDSVDRTPPADDNSTIVRVRGSVVSLIDRLDDEFTKSLKDIDPHASEYVDRLKHERSLYDSLFRVQSYLERVQQNENLQRIIMRRIEHVYAKPDAVTEIIEAQLSDLPSGLTPKATRTASQLMQILCTYLYRQEVDPRLRGRAMLCHIYHYALHDEYYRARDMFLMSHVQHGVHGTDIDTQILYNRTVAQLGLSAFRIGLVAECENTLRELMANRDSLKRSLAQGLALQRRGPGAVDQISPEQQRFEEAHHLPFHQHINLDLLEAAYLTASMLFEIPQLAHEAYDPERYTGMNKGMRSRLFRRNFDSFEKQVFVGPPENTRDYVMQASKALQQGDWQKCIDLIHSMKIWNLMNNYKTIKNNLAISIKRKALQTYLYTHAAFYANVSITTLSAGFAMPEQQVFALVSKLIWNEKLAASIDRSSKILSLQRADRTQLQQLAITLADKASLMLQDNERVASAKLGDGEQKSFAGGSGARDGADGQRRGDRPRGRGGMRGGRGGLRGAFNAPLGRTVAAGR
ncbi:uncharacterized protein L969DRAFT_90404 [Mixia osmundae IAM 14324]|uniref:Eukaryotic translation initiation factor 3 subunit C n=1 Tax=Mixia osmundae (strain CBS 9802 / IAM 14324 / JCM 22182 / KY 12970) TaxID=764103 RepID=G7E2D6_MIXOS|nr:uncharacterized protein L969DRAFT_90404 [Mixia osmundae IAM 14324]KEI36867.1 hypothetical protein L969DRAFT_90404 [Mixia osmundae IAM 14324]GAA96996.1 hypothetical protein E5Q_03670 [Mixia osmundae IAM 14324]